MDKFKTVSTILNMTAIETDGPYADYTCASKANSNNPCTTFLLMLGRLKHTCAWWGG